MELFLLVVSILDAIIIGFIVALICRKLFGDGPLARLLRLVLCIAGGGAYAFFCLNVLFGEIGEDMSLGTGAFIIFAPVALVLILMVVAYMFNGKNNESK